MYQAITNRVGFVPGGTNVGVVRIDTRHVMIIDSGLNDTIARRVLRAVKDELDSEVVAIVSSHGHADHFGAHAFVRKRTGAAVHAPELEACIIEHPELQPALLYGGADPLDDLKNRFLQAEPCAVDAIIDPHAGDLLGAPVQVVPLPGHSPNQLGFVFDGVFFCADAVFPKAAIEKYKLPYLYGLTSHLESLERCLTVRCSKVVPGHGPMEESIESLVRLNQAVIDQACQVIVDSLREPMNSDSICASLFREMEVPVNKAQGYYLLRPTVMAYLSHLQRQGEITYEVSEEQMLWRRS
jgi:glyoxylase-like metal-dependent hydrolase (beta-lactamase superfamily II)